MKKYYAMTLLAVIAVILIQLLFLKSQFDNYILTQGIEIKKQLAIAMDDEYYLRKYKKDGSHRTLRYKYADEMTQQEIDSIKRLPTGQDSINVEQLREWGQDISDLVRLVFQDSDIRRGQTPNLHHVDSLLALQTHYQYRCKLTMYDSRKQPIETAGDTTFTRPNFATELIPIGTQGFRYIGLEARIPMSHFLVTQVQILIASACFMLIALGVLAFQMIVIRKRTELLALRESTINGTIHDLKSPLGSVVAALSWLGSKPELAPAIKEMVGLSLTSVKTMAYNIELLVTARKDRQRLILKRTPTDVAELARNVKADVDILFCQKPHTISITNNLPQGYTANVDAMYLGNALRNLVENAVKYADDHVKVNVRLSATAGRLEIAVEDNGWGIAQKYQKWLFRQFYQVPRTDKEVRSGYGIGLAHCKCIVDEHGGTLRVKSEEGKGSTFYCNIPII